MKEKVIVTTKEELKRAIKEGASTIIIENASLAQEVRLVQMASKAALMAIVAGGGLLTISMFTPMGWLLAPAVAASGGTTVSLGGAALALVAVLGIAVFWALYNDYDVEAGGSAGGVSGSIKLNKR